MRVTISVNFTENQENCFHFLMVMGQFDNFLYGKREKDEVATGTTSQQMNQNLPEKHGKVAQANARWQYDVKEYIMNNIALW